MTATASNNNNSNNNNNTTRDRNTEKTTTTTRTTLSTSTSSCQDPCVPGDSNEIMRRKEHGTSATPVQSPLRWGCDPKLADRICNYNRHYAEHAGYWESIPAFMNEIENRMQVSDNERDVGDNESNTNGNNKTMTFYDSNTGKALFRVPMGRSWEDFLTESKKHGWPSFRDQEVLWDSVRVLSNGETVSIDGTHLGHNLPDANGRRYCINLVSVSGNPPQQIPDRDRSERDLL